MTKASSSILENKYLNGWNLLGWVSLGIAVLVAIPYTKIDPANPAHISEMIANSVRLAVPWLFVAFAASSLVFLFPNNFTKWIMRNRKIFGLCFAVGMAWQLFFILWFVIGSFDYYMEQSYAFHSLVEQVPGYLVLFAMVFTSFKAGRKMISNRQWRILHKGGIYLLWGILFSTYWYELYYYNDIQTIDHIYYWMGIGAWLARIAAWGKKRGNAKHFKNNSGELSSLAISNRIIALTLAAIGLFMIIFGESWAPQVLAILSEMALGQWFEHFIAFLPVIPLYAASLAASSRQPID